MDTGQKGALTPEQMAQLSKHKTAQPAQEQPAQQPVQPTAVIKTNQPRPKQMPRPKSVVQPVVQEQPVVEQPVVYSEATVETIETDSETYFNYQDSDGGALEMDLITFREKGQETRYLSMSILGVDMSTEPPAPMQSFLTIGSKDSFDKLKLFFSQLNWED